MKNVLMRLLLVAVLLAATGPVTLAAKKAKPPEEDVPAQTASEYWYLGVVVAIDVKASTMTILVKGSGETIQRRRGNLLANTSISSSTAKPGVDERKTFVCSRDCLISRNDRNKATLTDFHIRENVKIVFTGQGNPLVAQKIFLNQPQSKPK